MTQRRIRIQRFVQVGQGTCFALAVVFSIVGEPTVLATEQDASLEALLKQAEQLYEKSQGAKEHEKAAYYTSIQTYFNEIVERFPESEAAVNIILELSVGSIEPSAINSFLATREEEVETKIGGGANGSATSATASPEADRLAGTQPDVTKADQAAEPADRRFAEEVQRCFEAASAPPTEAFVVLEVSLGADGTLSDLPNVVEPDRAGPDERRLFRLGLEALEDCQPFETGAESSILRVRFSFDEVRVEGAQVATTGRGATNALERASLAASAPAGANQPRELPATNRVFDEEEESSSAGSGSERQTAGVNEERATTGRGTIARGEGGTPSTGAVQTTTTTLPRGTEDSESTLALSRGERLEVQRRLTLLGYDTRGVDGIFGRGTRSALAQWQTLVGVEPTGFLNARQLEELRTQTAAAYADWRAQRRAANDRRDQSGNSSSGRYIDGRGCLREGDGSYVPNFKSGCP